MDVSEQTASAVNVVKDDVGERCQKLFQDFLEEWVVRNGYADASLSLTIRTICILLVPFLQGHAVSIKQLPGWLKYAGTPGQLGSAVRRWDSRRDSFATPGDGDGLLQSERDACWSEHYCDCWTE